MDMTATSSAPLADKVVVITGASGQVGWGLAHAALDAGANVVLPVRSAIAGEALREELRHPRVTIMRVNFRDEGSLADIRDETLERLGRIDHVIAPLGAWWQKGASLEQPSSELRNLLDAYVETPLNLVKAFATALRASGGSYTFITGAAGEADCIRGAGLMVVAVKAQLGLSAVLRRELAGEPFRINEVRISKRIERSPRPGVIPSRVAGEALIKVLLTTSTGRLIRYDGNPLELEQQRPAEVRR
jgi:3-oxoacyl-[acyl-carrier protein] reductase